MEHRKVVYKENKINTRCRLTLSRDERNVSRAKMRSETFQSCRDMFISPATSPLCEEVYGFNGRPSASSTPAASALKKIRSQKENLCISYEAVAVPNMQTSPAANVIEEMPAAVENEKLIKKKEYMQRYIEWKRLKTLKAQQEKLQAKKRPFVTSVKAAGFTGTNQLRNTVKPKSFAPDNHKFNAPAGVQNPLLQKPKRQSFYTTVPTPPRKRGPFVLSPKNPYQPIMQVVPTADGETIIKSVQVVPNARTDKFIHIRHDEAIEKPTTTITSAPAAVVAAKMVEPVAKPPARPMNIKSTPKPIEYNNRETKQTHLNKAMPTSGNTVPKPAAAKPVITKSTATKPTATKSTAIKPTATKPTVTKASAPKQAVEKSTAAKPVMTKPIAATKLTAAKSTVPLAPVKPVKPFVPTPADVTESVTNNQSSVPHNVVENDESTKKTNTAFALVSSVVSNTVSSIVSSTIFTGAVKKYSTSSIKLSGSQKSTQPQNSTNKPSINKSKPTPSSGFFKPIPIKLPPALNGARTVTVAKAGGAVEKARQLQQKKQPQVTRNPVAHKNAKLAVNLKAKKTTAANAVPHIKIPKATKDRKLQQKAALINNTSLVTPIDFADMKTFGSVITSTQAKPGHSKSLSNEFELSVEISPVEVSSERTTMKDIDKNKIKSVMQDLNFNKFDFFKQHSVCFDSDLEESEVKVENINQKQKTAEENTASKANLPQVKTPPRFSFFNFRRPSLCVDSDVEMTPLPMMPQQKTKDAKNMEVPEAERLDNAQQTAQNEIPLIDDAPKAVENELKTPENVGDNRPLNYMSPFVTVSRGKVSQRKEQHKRNSIYLTNTPESATKTVPLVVPDTPVEVRRKLEAVRYYRKQLNDQISQFEAQCNKWEIYTEDHMDRLQSSNGIDMINVTIGQTRLLLTKKFMQFRGLIDRCEAGAKGLAAHDDGSEGTKPINDADLEGFWSMLGLQVENLEQRFTNLERWAANDWQDPDVEKQPLKATKRKPAQNKVQKAKTSKPNTALRDIMRKMQETMRQKKLEAANGEQPTAKEIDVIINTPKKRKSCSSQGKAVAENTNTPELPQCNGDIATVTESCRRSKRISVIVKDRKSFSPAATRVSVQAPNNRNRESNSPRVLIDGKKPVDNNKDLLKSALKSANDKKKRVTSNQKLPVIPRIEIDTVKTPPQLPRKSILKTPGTAKAQNKNVVFNNRLSVRKFRFLDMDEYADENLTPKREPTLEEKHENKSTAANDGCPEVRTYRLRTREVALVSPSTIIIPK